MQMEEIEIEIIEREDDKKEDEQPGQRHFTRQDLVRRLRRLEAQRAVKRGLHLIDTVGQVREEIAALRQQGEQKNFWVFKGNEFFTKVTFDLTDGIDEELFTERGVAIIVWSLDGTGTIRFENEKGPVFALEDLVIWPQRFNRFYLSAPAQAGKSLKLVILKDELLLGNLQPLLTTRGAPVTLSGINQLPAALTALGNLKVAIEEPGTAASEVTLASVLAALDVALSTRASEATLGSRASEATLALIKAKTDNLDVALSALAATGQLPLALTVAGNLKVALEEIGTAATEVTQAAILAALDVALSTRASEATLGSRASEATQALIKAKTDNLDVALSTISKAAQLPTALTASGNLKMALEEEIANETTGYSAQVAVGTTVVTLAAHAVPAGRAVALIPDTANTGQIAYTLDGATAPVVGTHAGLKANQGIAVEVANISQIKVIASAAGQVLNVSVEG